MSESLLKEEFDVFKRFVYLNWASVGDPPRKSIEVMQKYLEELKARPDELTNSEYYMKIIDNVKSNMGKILGCDKKNIALIGNSTTPGIQTAMNSINLKKGDELIIFDLDFPTVYAESLKWKNKGVNVKVIKNKMGDYDINEVSSSISKNTKAILVSSVFWVNGLRIDINELGEIIHENDGFLVVDAIQHVGGLKFDAESSKADFVAFGTQKWLLSPFSLGFLYVSKRALELTEPPNYGYLNLNVGMSWDEFWGDERKSPENNYKLNKGDAYAYEFGGFISIPALIGLDSTLNLINQIGIDNINDHILKLRNLLIENLQNKTEIVSPLDKKKSSGILTFKLYKRIKDNYDVVTMLEKKFSIKVSGRGSAGIGGIRTSIHFPNDENDIEKLSSAIKLIKD